MSPKNPPNCFISYNFLNRGCVWGVGGWWGEGEDTLLIINWNFLELVLKLIRTRHSMYAKVKSLINIECPIIKRRITTTHLQYFLKMLAISLFVCYLFVFNLSSNGRMFTSHDQLSVDPLIWLAGGLHHHQVFLRTDPDIKTTLKTNILFHESTHKYKGMVCHMKCNNSIYFKNITSFC